MKNKILSKGSCIHDRSEFIDNDKLSAPNKKYRAWVEIDTAALCRNAAALKKYLPDKCDIMPVLKANAYGHGDIECAKALNKIEIRYFCVATLEEAIRLRKNGIEGDILILGYTGPDEYKFISAYQLTQTIVSLNHALALNSKGAKIKTHIKIDTGMHRLGVDYNNIYEIESIFNCKNLKIEGVFSHLSSSDSLAYEDLLYTNMQIKRFFDTLSYLQIKGHDIGNVHIQASCGIINYPNLPCNYARAGIALYGVLSSGAKTLVKADLHPVLSLKARIAEIKNISIGEHIGYSRAYTSKNDIKVAAVTIGYADGVPRNLNKDFYVLIRGKKAFLVGLICMDQLIVDITNIPDAQEGDEVTIIGKDGDEQIKCEDLAQKCGTITNEILSRLSSRLDYIYL